MADYHHTYKGPEGQTTQWEDIQIKLGNMAPKPPKYTPEAYQGEKQEVRNAEWILDQDETTLTELDDEFEDDRALEEMRLKRISEMRSAASRPKFGTLDLIRANEFSQAVTEASHRNWVVVLLYKENNEGCQILSDCLKTLAQSYTHQKFVRIVSTDCIPNYPDANLPTCLVYHEGKCVKTLAGLALFGGKRASPELVALVLNQIGDICRRPGEEEGNGDNGVQDLRGLVKRVVLQRQKQLDEDEDSDFD